MEKTIFKRVTAFTAALTVTAGAAVSCSVRKNEENNGKAKDSKKLLSASYSSEEIPAEVDSVNSIYRIDENTILLSGYDYQSGNIKLLKSNNDFSEISEIKVDFGKKDDNTSSNMSAAVAPSGDIFVWETTTDYGEGGMPDSGDFELYDDDHDHDHEHEEAENKDEKSEADEEKSDSEEKKSESEGDQISTEAVKAERAGKPDTEALKEESEEEKSDNEEKKEDTEEKKEDTEEETSDSEDSEEVPKVVDSMFGKNMYQSENVKETHTIYVVDLEGNIKSKNEVKGLVEDEDDDESYGYGGINAFVPLTDSKAVVSYYGGMGEEFSVVGTDGKVIQKLDFDGADWVSNVCSVSDKEFTAVQDTGDSVKVVFYDKETLKPTGEEIKGDYTSNILYGRFFSGTGDYRLLSMNSDGLYGIKADGSNEELINWLDSDLGDDNGNISSLLPMDNGEYVIIYLDYSSEKTNATLYRLQPRDPEELKNIKVLTIGALDGDWNIRQQISEFNKAHKNVRFKIVDYSQFDSYDSDTDVYNHGSVKQLKEDIVSGKAPDMIFTNGSALMKSLGKKGLFVDLYEMLEKDPDLNKDDIMPNILKAGEVNGKLLSLSSSFMVHTLVAKKSNVKKEGMTASELIDLYENRPKKDTHLYGADTRDSIIELLYYSVGELIDYEKGECHFDDPDFKKFLNFIESFGEGIDYENASEEELDEYYSKMQDYFGADALKKDNVLLSDLTIYDIAYLNSVLNGEYKNVDMSFVGFPTGSGNGAVMRTSSTYAILSNCQDKDACWEIIKESFKEIDPDAENNKYSSSGIPALKKNFDNVIERAMNKPYYIDGDGKKIEYDDTYYDEEAQKEVKVNPLSKEQADYITKYIEATDMVVDDFDPAIEDVFVDELMPFIEGEKTADETAKLLQDRISLILSEQS